MSREDISGSVIFNSCDAILVGIEGITEILCFVINLVQRWCW